MDQCLLPGTKVEHAGRDWRVLRVLGPDAVLIQNDAGETVSANPAQTNFCRRDQAPLKNHHDGELRYSAAQWAEAERRRDVILAVSRLPARTRADIELAAKELGLKRRRLWELLRGAQNAGFEPAWFLPKTGQARAKRVDPSVEAIIKQAIHQQFARPGGQTLATLHENISRRCAASVLQAPSYRTVQARVRDQDQVWLTRQRNGPKAARALRLLVGSHPGASAPWERVQIDSTPCDIRLVREADRMVIGRATGTFAIDLYSRAILGFSVSLEGASTLTVATCLEHACRPKDSWLARRNLARLNWPIYGKPAILEYDQGPENEARGIQRGLMLHGIKSKIRPKGQPNQHGHIERVIGTLMKKIHQLPGTTFGNIAERGEIDPDKSACMTLPELEHAMALLIDSYNHTAHTSTGERPIDRYLNYYRQPGLSDSERIPPLVRENFILDFLPFERRELRRTGIRLFCIDYSSVDLLPLWNRDNQKPTQRVAVYDPRSLKQIWVADEVTGDYIAIPYRTPHPDMTLAENIAARDGFRAMKQRDRTERRLFDNLTAIQAVVNNAKSTSTRRKAERSIQARRSLAEREHKLAAIPRETQGAVTIIRTQPAWASGAVTPFSDVETM